MCWGVLGNMEIIIKTIYSYIFIKLKRKINLDLKYYNIDLLNFYFVAVSV